MHNRDKYPAIWAEMESANASLAPLLAERKKHTDAIADVQLKIEKLKAEKADLNEKAMAKMPEISELRQIVARCAIAMGAITT